MHIDIDAIIFDCDGTLVDSEDTALDVLHQVLLSKGGHFPKETIHRQFRGVPMAHCVAWIAGQLGQLSPQFQQELTREVRQITEQRFRQGLKALPGAEELLSRLKIPFCVATNGPREKVELTLGLAGLRPLFGQRVFSAYEVGSFKPAPGLFLCAAEALGVMPQRCAVVEDSLTGVQAGLAAGMQVFTLHPRSTMPADLAEQVCFIENLSHLDRLLHGGSQRIEPDARRMAGDDRGEPAFAADVQRDA
ncbi:6-phosphogluconate phosphatase [mine drainage metagenome]|uniref:6-phosphogluconate phosphatase n=1 Tax=mine drainage metagenome TaxID=410659 RepID=A0A1J5NYU1_9ZZZZ